MINQEFSKPIKVLFKIISDCNESCDFCSEWQFIKNRRPCLKKDEIIDNYNYLIKNFNIDSIIISGGEPTLHSEYFSILNFFSNQSISLKIITNLFKFSDSSFLKKHKNYFKKNKDWKIYGSINKIPLKETDLNIVALKNILENKIPVSIIVVAYKNNLEELSELIQFLSKLFAFSKTPLKLELRLMYIKEVSESIIDQCPKDFQVVSHCFSECLKIASSLGIILTLWNFPVCYINEPCNNLDGDVEKRKNIKIIKIGKDNQLQHFKVRDFNSFFFKSIKCKLCKYFENCSGINRKYINDFKFPRLKLITEQYV